MITVGSFHAGSKVNIISDSAQRQLTVRSESAKTRELLLDAIRRVAINTAPANGVAENQLPEVNLLDEATPPTLSDPALTRHRKQAWTDKLGAKTFDVNYVRSGMGAEDFPLQYQAEYFERLFHGRRYQQGGARHGGDRRDASSQSPQSDLQDRA